jgi:hypothetical protein
MVQVSTSTKSDPVSSVLMDEILSELRPTLPIGIEYVGRKKTNDIISFEFKADEYIGTINYDEIHGTFVPVKPGNPNDYNWNISLKDLIFNKEGYLQALQDYLISTMNLVSQKHYGYFVKGFRFGGSQVWLLYNFGSDPDIEVEVITIEHMEEVTDKSQKDTILALKRLFESSLTKSLKLQCDTGVYANYASPLLSQQISYELSKKSGEISDMPTLFFGSKTPNPQFKPQQVIANTILDFSININKAVRNKMQRFLA